MSTKPSPPSQTAFKTEAVTGARSHRQRADGYLLRRWAGRTAGYVVLIALSILSIFPLLWMVSTSLRERYDVFGGPLIPQSIRFDAYTFVFEDFQIFTFFSNSILITGITVFAVVIMATMAGYAFAHLEFWGKEIIFLILLGTLMVPPAVLILPLFLQLRDFGLVDT
ncbi:MAG: carbohydrate ABC transporter permease, partial [Anaerolineae bacterium]|nr:carbohydrate ABC transporter permease [Anaerolineae bacterium]